MKPVPLLIAAAGLALLAACSGPPAPPSPAPPSPAPAGPAQTPGAVAYSQCMRSHGLPGFPDPASNGALPKTSAQALGVSDDRFQAAQRACQPLLPSAASFQQQAQQCLSADTCPPAVVQQM